MEELTATSDVIDRLGGISSVADLTGSKYNAVANWVSAATFPSKFYVVMLAALEPKGFTAPASLWGMVKHDEVRA